MNKVGVEFNKNKPEICIRDMEVGQFAVVLQKGTTKTCCMSNILMCVATHHDDGRAIVNLHNPNASINSRSGVRVQMVPPGSTIQIINKE